MAVLYFSFALTALLCAVIVADPLQPVYQGRHVHEKTSEVKGNHLRLRIAIGVSVDISSGESCPTGHIPCKDQTQCIPEYWWCDAHDPADCRDGSDEELGCVPVVSGNATEITGFSVDIGEGEEQEENEEEEQEEEGDSSSSSSSASDEEISIESLPRYLLDKLADAFEDAAEALEVDESSEEEEGSEEEETSTVHEMSTTSESEVTTATMVMETSTLPACPEDYILCKADGSCYPLSFVCESAGLYNCVGVNEAINCNCSSDYFTSCANGLCVPKQQICDGYKNCPDGSDESAGCGMNCPAGRVPCNDMSQCIPESYWCDGYPVPDCQDGSDEGDNCVVETTTTAPGCADDKIFCADIEQCHTLDTICKSNGIWQFCPNQTINCTGKCAEGNTACKDGTQCIQNKFWCDAVTDCNDGSDEEPGCAPISPPSNNSTTVCAEDEILCQADGGCYPKHAVCTNRGLHVCIDLNEPIECNCSNISSYYGTCAQGVCFPQHKFCDGIPDCWDASDEPPKCGKNCPAGTVPCKDQSKCIQESRWCDGFPVPECSDGSDEEPGCELEHGGLNNTVSAL